MQQEQQQLFKRDTYTPTDASQVCSSVAMSLNREETLSEHGLKTLDNNPDVNLHRHTGGLKAKVYVKSIENKPLMPCTPAKARHLLKDNRAEVISVKPFTIRLNFECENKVQPITLGIDSGYKYVGFSAITEKVELISGELKLRIDISKKIQDKAMYRKIKRNKLWYRKPRFLNRVKSKKKGWLAPSIRHKVDTHIRLIDKLKGLLPISDVTIEVAKFDTQKLQNADIKGIEYQQGQMQGYDNLRAFVLYRDNYVCQICNKKDGVMNIHHIIHKTEGGSDRPDNLVTVHKSCHDKFHKGKIKHEFKKPKLFKQTVVMNSIRKYIADELGCNHTYGYITKRQRITLQLDKSHVNDAFVIANGYMQERSKLFKVKQVRRNNRCLQLNRNGFKIAIRRQRYKFQPNDKILFNNMIYNVNGVRGLGKRIVISNHAFNKKDVAISKVLLMQYGKGLDFIGLSLIHPLFKKGGTLEVC